MPRAAELLRDERSLGRVVADAALTLGMDVLAGRTTTVALVLVLGGGPIAVGALAALGPLGALFQIPGLWLLARLGRRKPLLFSAAVPARALWLGVALIALLPPSVPRVEILAALLLARAALAALGQCAHNAWMRDLLPMAELGRFYAVRMRVAEVTGFACGLLAAAILGLVERRALGAFGAPPRQTALALVFALAFLLGQASLGFLAAVPEAPRPSRGGRSVMASLLRVAGDRTYRRYLAAMALWLLGSALTGPYVVLFQVERLGLPVPTLLLLEALEKGVLLLALGRWGRLADRNSGAAVLSRAAPLYGLVLLGLPALTLLPRSAPVFWLALLAVHVALGISVGACTLALNTLAFRLAPADEGASYLVARSVLMNGVTAVAPLLGAAALAMTATGTLLPWLVGAGGLLVASSALVARRIPKISA